MQNSRSYDTRQRLLAAAATVLADEGYAATSLSHVAARIGLTKGAFAYHFPTKDTISRALRDDYIVAVDRLEAQGSAAFPGQAEHAFLAFIAGIGALLVTDPIFRGGTTLSFDLSAPHHDTVDMLAHMRRSLESFISRFDTDEAGDAAAVEDMADVVLWLLLGRNFTGRRIDRNAPGRVVLIMRVLLEVTHVKNPQTVIDDILAWLQSDESGYQVVGYRNGELRPI